MAPPQEAPGPPPLELLDDDEEEGATADEDESTMFALEDWLVLLDCAALDDVRADDAVELPPTDDAEDDADAAEDDADEASEDAPTEDETVTDVADPLDEAGTLLLSAVDDARLLAAREDEELARDVAALLLDAWALLVAAADEPEDVPTTIPDETPVP